MRRFAPLAALAAAAAGALAARRRSAGGPGPASSDAPASPTAPDPAVRAAAAQATMPGPAPAAEPGPISVSDVALESAAADGPAPAPAPPPATGETHPVGLYVLHQGPRADKALMALAEALGETATLGPPDDVGRFDAQVTAESPDAATERVRAALRTSGTGDDFTIVTTAKGREMPSDDPRQPDR